MLQKPLQWMTCSWLYIKHFACQPSSPSIIQISLILSQRLLHSPHIIARLRSSLTFRLRHGITRCWCLCSKSVWLITQYEVFLVTLANPRANCRDNLILSFSYSTWENGNLKVEQRAHSYHGSGPKYSPCHGRRRCLLSLELLPHGDGSLSKCFLSIGFSGSCFSSCLISRNRNLDSGQMWWMVEQTGYSHGWTGYSHVVFWVRVHDTQWWILSGSHRKISDVRHWRIL